MNYINVFKQIDAFYIFTVWLILGLHHVIGCLFKENADFDRHLVVGE